MSEAAPLSSGKVKLQPDTVTAIKIPWQSTIEVITDGTAEIWYRFGPTPPTIGGAHCWYIPAGGLMADRRTIVRPSGTDLLLISPGSPVVVVQR